MNDDINSHIEPIRKLFRERFNDLFKGKDDLEKPIDNSDGSLNEALDDFDSDLIGYIAENKLEISLVEELIKYFRDTGLNADDKIWDELDKICDNWDGHDL